MPFYQIVKYMILFGIEPWLPHCFANFLQGWSRQVKIEKGLSDINIGVPQGGPLSSLLFYSLTKSKGIYVVMPVCACVCVCVCVCDTSRNHSKSTTQGPYFLILRWQIAHNE